jgi:hypothetical protein
MNQLTIRNGKIYLYGEGEISDLAIVVKADEGKVLSCGNYDAMTMICKYAAPINGWDMRVIRIRQEDPGEAVHTVERLNREPELCKKIIRAYASGEPVDLAATGADGPHGQ